MNSRAPERLPPRCSVPRHVQPLGDRRERQSLSRPFLQLGDYSPQFLVPLPSCEPEGVASRIITRVMTRVRGGRARVLAGCVAWRDTFRWHGDKMYQI